MKFVVNGANAFSSTGGRTHKKGQQNLVFIHGSGQNRLTWTQQGRKAAYRGYNVLALDLPGHGQSEGPALESVEETAQWIVSAMDVIGFDTASIIGHSQGCLEALEIASTFSNRVEKAIFIAGAMAIPVNDTLVNWAENEPSRAYSAMTGWGLGELGHKHDNSVPGHSHIGGGVQLMDMNVQTTLSIDLKACNAYKNGRNAATAISCPVLVLLGEQDKMTPIKFGRKMAQAIPNTTLIEFANTGHMLPVERPAKLNAAIFDFLEN